MLTLRRLIKISPALIVLALVVPSSAFGQATRTWVSGVGDDANPCSRTAPCKTFAGAISKTANAGEINCLDPGGFGGVTITKSLTIKCHYTEGGVLVAGTNAIVINGTATDKITLKGLDVLGTGVGAPTALVGIKVLQAGSVHIIDSEVQKFKTGIAVVPSAASTRVIVSRSHIHDNNIGVFNGPAGAGVGFTVATLLDDLIADNVCGSVTSSAGPSSSTPDTNVSECGASSGLGFNKQAVTSILHTGIHDNSQGVHARGSQALAEIAYDTIEGNSSLALHRLDTAVIRTFSPATNVIGNNAGSDTTNSTVPLVKRHFKKYKHAAR
jgi:hypothetical protein